MPTPRYVAVQDVLQSRGVRRKVADVADRMAAAAATIAAAERADVRITRSDGTRPLGRPYSRISIPAVDEFGDSKTRRLRLLARVVGR